MNHILAGGFGGLCTTLFGHPLDTIKVRMQSKPNEYRNTWDAVFKIISREGPSGLYKVNIIFRVNKLIFWDRGNRITLIINECPFFIE